MGNKFSTGGQAQKDADFLDLKLAEIIKKKAKLKSTQKVSLNKLLLRFGALHAGFNKVKDVFHALDQDGNNTIDIRELREGCQTLGFHISEEMVTKVFNASDLDHNHVVDYREFIVVLAVLYMLEEGENELDPEIVKSFNIAEEAFLFFDASQDGFMDREEVMKALSDTGSPMKGKNTNWNINNIFAKRFAELDWDNNGQISFKEFLYAVEGWVLDEGEDASGP